MRTTPFTTLPATLPVTLLVTLLVTSLTAALLHPAYAADHTAATSTDSAAARAATSADLKDFVGQYTLSDGRTLTVIERRRQLVAAIEGQTSIALVPAGYADGTVLYAAPGTSWQLAFDRRRNGNVAGVVLTVGGSVATDNQAPRR